MTNFLLFIIALLLFIFAGFLAICILYFYDNEKLENTKNKIINFILKMISAFLNFAFETALIATGQYKRYQDNVSYNKILNRFMNEFTHHIRLKYEENDFLNILIDFYLEKKTFYFYFYDKLSAEQEKRVKEVIRTCFYQATNNFEIETFSKIYLNYEGYYQLDLLYDTTDNVQRRRYNLKSEQDKKDEYDKDEILGAWEKQS